MLHPYSLDKPLAAVVAKLPEKVNPLMVFASFIAAPPAIAVILITVVLLAGLQGNEQLLRTCLLVMVVSPVAELSKLITRRRRPETLYVEQMRFKTYSFPSGHSYISALVFGFLALSVGSMFVFGWLAAALLLLLVLCVGVSRVYLGAHFPSDVIAGWALGGVLAYIVTRIGM